jgi:hypothetical protein
MGTGKCREMSGDEMKWQKDEIEQSTKRVGVDVDCLCQCCASMDRPA